MHWHGWIVRLSSVAISPLTLQQSIHSISGNCGSYRSLDQRTLVTRHRPWPPDQTQINRSDFLLVEISLLESPNHFLLQQTRGHPMWLNLENLYLNSIHLKVTKTYFPLLFFLFSDLFDNLASNC